jgi:FG-GAP-like repeat/PASTA domain
VLRPGKLVTHSMVQRLEGWSARRGARSCAALLACIGFALVLGAVGRSATGPTPTFAAPKTYAAGKDPDSPAIADLNGDGRPDLAVTNARSVSVLLNRGDGSFEAKHDYATRREPDSLAIADLNGDGSPDVATRVVGEHYYWQQGHGTLAVLLNKGDGTFKRRSYTTGSERDPDGANVVVSDLNGDGRPDLATAVGRISVLVNRGDGSFQAKVEYPSPGGPLASADLNGDDKPDLVTTGSRSLHVLINTPGLCNVQGVVGMTPAAAKRELARVNCRAGKVSRASSKRVKKGRVVLQKPRFGAVLRGGSKVTLVVSRGRKPS